MLIGSNDCGMAFQHILHPPTVPQGFYYLDQKSQAALPTAYLSPPIPKIRNPTSSAAGSYPVSTVKTRTNHQDTSRNQGLDENLNWLINIGKSWSHDLLGW